MGQGNRTGPQHEVVVVGAGFSGIGAGIKLKQAGIDDFVMLEQAGDVGGTWRDNTYPGVAVDITSFSYQFSFEQNPAWSRVFAPGRELKAYADHCVDRYGLRPHLRFHRKVEQVTFDPETHTWDIALAGGDRLTSRFLICCGGGLTQPKPPDIPGVETFAGKTMHTARWDHDHDLRGKRVAIIGTGASAVQVVPSIAREVAHLDVFQRTAIWLLPKPDAALPRSVATAFRRIPGLQQLVRMEAAAITEAVMVLAVMYHRQLPLFVRAVQALCRAHLRSQVRDPKLRAALTPTYDFGCKRPSFSNDYLRTFNRRNVDLVTAPIERITPTGIRTADGAEREVDTLILATGFKVFEPGNAPSFDINGLDGMELGRWWDQNRYQAYEGATVPGFPNFFLVLGPYSVTGASWFSMVEAQTRHAVRCIQQARRRNATWVAVKPEPHDRFFAEIQHRQQSTVFFNADCATSNSYYFDRHGDAPFLRPATGLELWWRSRTFPLEDYEYRSVLESQRSANGSSLKAATSR
jgi:cation diffusion facilitator CzcD-associated flavoprotein CzcO